MEKAAALLFYREGGLVQGLIHALKYRGREEIGTFLGRWYACRLAREGRLQGMDLVLPVPLHPGKQRKRGYNQCSRFGQEIAKGLKAQYAEDLLLKTRSTPTQTSKNRWLRWQGTAGVFQVPRPDRLRGKRILLVDDVITTGATLESCCRVLSGAGGAKIYIAAMALVP